MRHLARRSGVVIYKRAPSVALTQQSQFDSLRLHNGPKILRELRDGLIVEQFTLPPQEEESLADQLEATGAVEFAEPDYIVYPNFIPNDAQYASAWHLPLIGAPAAWDLSTGSGSLVAILDTGVDPDHPDLAARLVSGWNLFNNNNDFSDVNGHGTKVAGVAAAIGNNAIGVTGVAWNASIMPLRISDLSGGATWSDMGAGIYYAADHGARIASISYADSCGSAFINTAAQYMRTKNGIVVIAAGNTGAETTAEASPDITCVSATDSLDHRPSWSSFGPSVDVAAPGVGIQTTINGGSYGSVSGTSFATPLTAGIYSLMMSANPALTSAELDTILFSTALDLGAVGRDDIYGNGRVDVAAAVLLASGSSADTTPPVLSAIATAGITTSAATISWTSDETATSQVEYGLTTSYGSLTTLNASLVTSHSQSLSGLTAGTLYHFRVKSKDASDNLASSSDQTLTTLSLPETPTVVTLHNNPFNPNRGESLVIEVVTSQSGSSLIRIYDLGGTLVRNLGEQMTWDGRDEQGELVRDGAFLCEVRYPGGVQIKKTAVKKH